MSYVVTTFFRTSGSRPWGSKLGYCSLRLNTRRGLLSGPVSRGERAKMHCFRLATAERPHSSLKDAMAFCREWRKRNYSLACMNLCWFTLACQAKHASNGISITKSLKGKEPNIPAFENMPFICPTTAQNSTFSKETPGSSFITCGNFHFGSYKPLINTQSFWTDTRFTKTHRHTQRHKHPNLSVNGQI